MGCLNAVGIRGILCEITGLLSYVIPVLIALGVVYFIWGVVQYVIADGEEAKTKGRDSMVFGIIGLAVIVAMWGLVWLLIDSFGIDSPNAPSSDALRRLLPQ